LQTIAYWLALGSRIKSLALQAWLCCTLVTVTVTIVNFNKMDLGISYIFDVP